MKQDIKTQWIEALRSGKYEQGQNRLCRDGSSFCCLGVLCEVLPDVNRLKSSFGPSTTYYRDNKNERMTICLSDTVREEVELSNSEESMLISMNDASDCTFEDIANYIEEKL